MHGKATNSKWDRKWDCLGHSWGKREIEIKITGWGHNVSFLVSFHSKLHCGRRGEWLGCARSDLLVSSSFHPSLLWACLVYLCMCNTHIVYVKHVMRKLFIKFHGLNKFSNTPPPPCKWAMPKILGHFSGGASLNSAYMMQLCVHLLYILSCPRF